jgi:hypothetical protein
MIDFIAPLKDKIILWKEDTDMPVCVSNIPTELANQIMIHGGPAATIYRSSEWDDSPYREKLDEIWQEVCDFL